MHALEVLCNGSAVVVAGSDNCSMISAMVNVAIEEEGATIYVAGMNDLGNDRRSHTSWLSLEPLSRGDVLSFRFIETDTPTPPAEEIATDSPEYLAQNAEYEKELRSNPPSQRVIKVVQPDATLQMHIVDAPAITIAFQDGRQFLSFRALWNRWQPERCSISLHSFSLREAFDRTGGKDWFRGNLAVGEQCVVTIGA